MSESSKKCIYHPLVKHEELEVMDVYGIDHGDGFMDAYLSPILSSIYIKYV